jgi:hypothetical protein
MIAAIMNTSQRHPSTPARHAHGLRARVPQGSISGAGSWLGQQRSAARSTPDDLLSQHIRTC